jgi:hypothetical protein
MYRIHSETSAKIQELAQELTPKTSVYSDTHQFAIDYEDRTYEDEEIFSFRTLIVGDEESLAVGVSDEDDRTVIFLNIDLQKDGVPMIVHPDFGDRPPVEAVNAIILGEKIGRPVIRALTEYEGNALIEDLEAIITQADINRLTP